MTRTYIWRTDSTNVDQPSRSRELRANPPATLWRELWFNTTPDGNSLVMNAAIFRADHQLVGEFYCFWNGIRLSQLDCRIVDQPDRMVLEPMLIEKANVIFRRVGLPEVESSGWSNRRMEKERSR